jgi:opacity protein-like surface antigen
MWKVLLAAAIGCATSVAMAQEGGATQADTSLTPSGHESRLPLTFAVSPFAGYRFGGSFTLTGTDTHVDVDDHAAYALALDLSTDHQQTQYELFYSRQSTSLGSQSPVPSGLVVEYLHIGGTADLFDSAESRLQPYAIGSLGATRFSPDGGSRKTKFSASLGVGVRTAVTQHVAFRLEARGFFTVLSSSTAVFCRSDQSGGLCQIQGRGTSFIQADILAGVSYAF